MLLNRFSAVGVVALLGTGSVLAGAMDRPVGIKIGQRMTLKPYFSMAVTYDSNIDGRADSTDDIVWLLQPGLGFEYRSDAWTVIANLWMQNNTYTKNKSTSHYNYNSYGEDVTMRWTDSLPGERGWSLMLSEKYLSVAAMDDMSDPEGRTYGRDRDEFKFAGALQRRFTDKIHADLNGNYYWLDYDFDNHQNNSYGLYGWERWGIGAEVGYAFSCWTDLLFAGSYQDYKQENRDNNWYDGRHPEYGMSSGASGWTGQIGLGSFATERLTYRVLAGWSTYEYDEAGGNSDGFTYTIAANWTISDTWKSMILATSYYQPNEREFGSSTRVDSLSWGVTHAMVQGKLHGTFDLAFRREGREYSAVQSYDYNIDVITARLGLTYIVNRYLQLYTSLEYRQSTCEDSDSVRGSYYDYDRFRGTLGLRFTY